MKRGVDVLLSQIIQYYKRTYRSEEGGGVPSSSPLPSVASPSFPSPPPSSITSPPSSIPSPPPPPPIPSPPPPIPSPPPPSITSPSTTTSPPPSLPSSSSYSSFYSYTRTFSQGDITTIIDPFDSVPATSRFYVAAAQSDLLEAAEPSPSRWGWLGRFFAPSSATPLTPAPKTSSLPPSLQHVPLYLFALRRGCLFGDCFHNPDLLQINRLHFTASSLQDSLRLLLPRLLLARDDLRHAAPLRRIYSGPIASPPPLTPIQTRASLPPKKGHRRAVGSGSLGLPNVQSMPLLPGGSSSSLMEDVNSEVVFEKPAPKPDDNEYIEFVPESGGERTAYYLQKKFTGSPPQEMPVFSILPPETLALLSDSIVVLDAEREIFVWIGYERLLLQEDPVYDACIALALSLTQERYPPSIIRVVKEGSSNSRYVLCNLIPSHKDPVEASMKTLPVLETLPPPLLKKHYGKFMRTDDMSFREYMTKIYHFREWCVCSKQAYKEVYTFLSLASEGI